VQSHDTKTQPSVLLSNEIHLLVRKLGFEGPANEKLNCKSDDIGEFLEGLNATKVQAP
jgi:hypothetical protein